MNLLHVLRDVSLDFSAGEVTAILGPSGCGKTTMLQILAGLEPATSGTVEFTLPRRPRIGYVFQRDRLFPWRTVTQNAIFGLEIGDGKSTDAKQRAITMLSNLGLAEFLDAYPDSLSEGMRQRVALCRALVFRPEVLLLDEPLSSLDFDARLAAEDAIRSYTRQTGAVAIIVTHDLDEAIAIADHLVLLTPRPAQLRKSWNLTFKQSTESGIAIRSDPRFKSFVSELVGEILNAHEGAF